MRLVLEIGFLKLIETQLEVQQFAHVTLHPQPSAHANRLYF